MSIDNDELTKLCLDYLYLQEELNYKQGILNDMYDEIQNMLEGVKEISIVYESLEIKKSFKLKEKFDTKRFQKEHKHKYEECREEKKRFNSDLVKEKYPEYYEDYLSEVEESQIIIRRIGENVG